MYDRSREQSITVLKSFLKLAIPTSVSMLAMNLALATNVYFAGHLDDANMIAGVGLATTA